MTASFPADRQTVAALTVVSRALGAGAAYHRAGRFYFDLGDGWALGVSPDSAGRFRIDACYGLTEVSTMWALAGDLRRLADLALDLRHEIAAVAASKG